MTNPRRRAREFALQGIYQWQFTGEGAAQVLKNLSELDEFDSADQPFLKAQLTGTIAESAQLRGRIEPLVDRKWDELSPIERGILDVQLETGIPVANGVLTSNTEEQARARAAVKGAEAARVAVEMANTLKAVAG